MSGVGEFIYPLDDLVDAHHHLWDLSRLDYPWLSRGAPPRPFGDHRSIQKNYLTSDYLSDMSGLPLRASVVVEAACASSDPSAEADWLAEELTSDRNDRHFSFRIVAALDLVRHDALGAIAPIAANPHVAGVRLGLAWRKDSHWKFAQGPGFSRAGIVREALQELATRNLSLDLIVLPEQLDEVVEIATAFPSLSIAVNHLATAEQDSLDVWKNGISNLSPCSNVAIKLSGLWSLSRSWNPQSIGPAIRQVLVEFGAGRLMWGSNMPVEGVMCPVRQQVANLWAALGEAGLDEYSMIFAGTARNFYWPKVTQ